MNKIQRDPDVRQEYLDRSHLFLQVGNDGGANNIMPEFDI